MINENYQPRFYNGQRLDDEEIVKIFQMERKHYRIKKANGEYYDQSCENFDKKYVLGSPIKIFNEINNKWNDSLFHEIKENDLVIMENVIEHKLIKFRAKSNAYYKFGHWHISADITDSMFC